MVRKGVSLNKNRAVHVGHVVVWRGRGSKLSALRTPLKYCFIERLNIQNFLTSMMFSLLSRYTHQTSCSHGADDLGPIKRMK